MTFIKNETHKYSEPAVRWHHSVWGLYLCPHTTFNITVMMILMMFNPICSEDSACSVVHTLVRWYGCFGDKKQIHHVHHDSISWLLFLKHLVSCRLAKAEAWYIADVRMELSVSLHAFIDEWMIPFVPYTAPVTPNAFKCARQSPETASASLGISTCIYYMIPWVHLSLRSNQHQIKSNTKLYSTIYRKQIRGTLRYSGMFIV